MINIRINSINWTVIFCQDGDPALNGEQLASAESEVNESVLGITRFTQARIYIREDVHSDIIYRTLKHELCHAYLFSYGLDGDNMSEEDIANFIESHAEKIVEDAKYLYDWFKSEENTEALLRLTDTYLLCRKAERNA